MKSSFSKSLGLYDTDKLGLPTLHWQYLFAIPLIGYWISIKIRIMIQKVFERQLRHSVKDNNERNASLSWFRTAEN